MGYDIDSLLEEEVQVQKRPVIKKKPKNKKWLYVFGGFIILCLLGAGGAAVYANMAVAKNDCVLEGISYSGVYVGGLSYEDAQKTVTDTAQGIIDNSVIAIECIDGIKHDFNIRDTGASFDAKSETDRLYAIGHEGNYLKRAYDYYHAKLNGFNVDADIRYPSDLSENIAALIAESVSVVKREPTYAITSVSVIFFNGKDGVHVKKEELKLAVEKILSNLESGATKYELTGYVVSDPYNRIDLESIKSSVVSPPADARYYQNGEGKWIFDQDAPGKTFDYELAKKNLEDADLNFFVIPIEEVKAQITLDDLKADLFSDVLSEKNTTLANNPPRTHNVALASQKISGTILNPGDEFSFNTVVGERTYEAGFKDAKIYVKDEMVDGVGGGICQVSSTLYLSALYADLEITERRNHRFTVTYIPLGQDATVMYGSIDFKFKNNRNGPICLYLEVSGNKLYVKIVGKKEAADEGKVVEIHSNSYNKKSYETVTKIDESLAPGKTKVDTHGTNGYTVETYKKITVNGEVVSDEFLHKSVYVPCNEVILVGPNTKPADTQVTLPSDPSQTGQQPSSGEELPEEPETPGPGNTPPANEPVDPGRDITTVPGFI